MAQESNEMTQDNYTDQPRNESYPTPTRPNQYGDERVDDLRSEQRAVMRGDRDPNDPRVIRQNIERRRAQMSETINRIQYRLDPDRLRYEAEEAVRDATIGKVEDMAYKARRKMERTQRGVIQKVKSNPIPAALIGLGLGWLMMSGNNEDEQDYDYDRYRYGYDRYGYDYDYDYDYDLYDRSRYMGSAEYDMRYEGYPSADYRYGERGMSRGYGGERSRMDEARGRIDEARGRVNQAAESAREQVEGVAHQAQDQLEHVRDRVQEGASELTDRVQSQAQQLRYQARMQSRRTRRNFDQAMDSNPLAVGALALAAGALIGLAVPSTEVENRWMGEQRDELLDEAKEQVQEGLEKVKSVANEAKKAVEDASDDVSKGKSAGQAAKEAINRTEQEAKQQNLTGTSKS
jgi:ElaB/YqjD/DUF883 family membrane-anchored ribosome-binding protein